MARRDIEAVDLYGKLVWLVVGHGFNSFEEAVRYRDRLEELDHKQDEMEH